MPLDASFFTLLVRPRAGSPSILDFLVDRSGIGEPDEPVYTALKDPSTDTVTLHDAPTSALLGRTRTAPPAVPNAAADRRHRLVELEAPAAEVHLRNKPGLTWCWDLEWEGARFTWARDVAGLLGGERGYTLSADRKPDPSFPVLVFSPRKKGGSIEVLDHNLARVEPPIQDKKGLEIASLLALCHFIDHLFPTDLTSPSPGPPSPALAAAAPSPPLARVTPPQPLRPPPERKKSSLTTLATNEIEVTDTSEPTLDAHCERALHLLEDPSLLYLSISTSTPSAVPAVAALGERVKRRRYKVSGEEVRLFVDDDGAARAHDEAAGRAGGKGKGKARQSYAAPPTALKLFLSRIDMTDILPNHRRTPTTAGSARRPPRPPVRPPINFDDPAPPTRPSPPPRPQPHPSASSSSSRARLARRHRSDQGDEPADGPQAVVAAAEPGGETASGASGWFSSLLGGRG
ncbi:hypothetical protein JCM9279_006003 [Rhodotorula babjevae]